MVCRCGAVQCYVCRAEIGEREGYGHYCQHFRDVSSLFAFQPLCAELELTSEHLEQTRPPPSSFSTARRSTRPLTFSIQQPVPAPNATSALSGSRRMMIKQPQRQPRTVRLSFRFGPSHRAPLISVLFARTARQRWLEEKYVSSDLRMEQDGWEGESFVSAERESSALISLSALSEGDMMHQLQRTTEILLCWIIK